MNELQQSYQSKIEKCVYTVIHSSDLSPYAHAICNPVLQMVIFNDNIATTFDYVHEFEHIALDHHGRLTSFNGNDERNPNEQQANKVALNELARYHVKNDFPLNIETFINWYGVPNSLSQQSEAALKEALTSINP